jgi:hypothetical protein
VAREGLRDAYTGTGAGFRVNREAANPTASAAASATGTALRMLTRLRASADSARSCIR